MASVWYEALHERAVVVYIDPELGQVCLWNGSLTLNWYGVSEDGREWYAIDCNTLQGDDRGRATLEEAIESAHELAIYGRGEGA